MSWHFGPFRLDLTQAALWRAEQLVPLRPKTLALLAYLVAHAGQLVTKEALLDAVWPETAVGDGVLKTSIGELRKALGETAKVPRWIATVQRRGYRFVAPVTQLAPSGPATAVVPALPPVATRPLIEREAVLHHLHAALAQARQGMRQVVFLMGEPGIGKTAAVEAFAAQVSTASTVWLATGQCVEHYGTGEPYLPVLEALGQLCRGPGGAHLVSLLRQQAPTWLVQLPWLLTPTDREQLPQEVQGVTRERMLRECAEVLESLTAETVLVLVLEDLHWSDYATVDLLALLMRRREPACLLLLGTFRAVETIVHGHPLRTVVQDLQRAGYGTALPLAPLSAAAVAAYLAARFPGPPLPAALAPWLHEHTDGNPLFLVTMVSALVERGVLVEQAGNWSLQGPLDAAALGVPDGVRPLLEQQIERLPAVAQQVLEVASVAGGTFAAAVVAAGLEQPVAQVEPWCEGLARYQLLQPLGLHHWPDGTVSTRYTFTHALYQQTAYERLGVGRRAQLHQRLGTRLEAAYGSQAHDIAAELAEHFVRGHETARAVQYLQQAGENAMRRCAHPEAIRLFTQGLEVLSTLPESPERFQRELGLQVPLGTAWARLRGWGASEVGQAYTRARVLCECLGATSQLLVVLLGQFFWCLQQAKLQTTQELGEHLLTLAQRQSNPVFLLATHVTLGMTLFLRGAVAPAHAHLAQGNALYVPADHHALVARYSLDFGVLARCFAALSLWLLGAPAQALAQMHEARTLAEELSHPYSLAFVLVHMMRLQQWRRDVSETLKGAETVMVFCAEHGFEQYFSHARLQHGWALVAQGYTEEGLEQLRQGLSADLATGPALWRPYYFAVLAEGYGQAGAADEGLRVLNEALTIVQDTGERVWEAELSRLRGELLLHTRRQPSMPKGSLAHAAAHTPLVIEAAACFHQALAVARQQQARVLELRAAMSLARLWQQQGKRTAARELLAPIYGWFTEGFDTADLQEARALLEELGG
jgi:DNA-binding winged helix-turn-helix (wHTH) protein/predicted ATPase